jgi:glycosyltransferase involved in cell wall biosynthesis
LRRLRADVLHSPVAAVPLRGRVPSIATVHDLPWLHADSGERAPLRQRLATQFSLRAAAVVLAPSRFTAAAANALVLPTRPVRVVPHATPPPADAPLASDRRAGPLLALGDDRPRKNRERVQRAIAVARRECDAVPAACFAGHPYNVVDDEAKASLLRGCRALLHVSLYEGFGLPVLEGLAHGIPVLCS